MTLREVEVYLVVSLIRWYAFVQPSRLLVPLEPFSPLALNDLEHVELVLVKHDHVLLQVVDGCV